VLSQDGTVGDLRIAGTVYDGPGDPVYDSLIATWEADPHGAEAASTDAPGA
jgi:protocatechuate 3,4-dioxygenase beta subunit